MRWGRSRWWLEARRREWAPDRWASQVGRIFYAVLVGWLWSSGYEAFAVALVAYSVPCWVGDLELRMNDLLMLLRISDRLGPVKTREEEECTTQDHNREEREP